MAEGFIKHDIHTLDDTAMMTLVYKYHEAGYGVFWAVVERLTNEPTHHLPIDNLAMQVAMRLMSRELDMVKAICSDMVTFGLLKEEDGMVYSSRVCRQCMELDQYKEKQRASINARWEQYRKAKAEADAETPVQKENTTASINELMDTYHAICKTYPQVKVLTEQRKVHVRTFMKMFTKEQITEGFTKAESSDFLHGNNGSWSGANFDWLINKNNFAKVLEGNYDNKTKATRSSVCNNADSLVKDKDIRGSFEL